MKFQNQVFNSSASFFFENKYDDQRDLVYSLGGHIMFGVIIITFLRNIHMSSSLIQSLPLFTSTWDLIKFDMKLLYVLVFVSVYSLTLPHDLILFFFFHSLLHHYIDQKSWSFDLMLFSFTFIIQFFSCVVHFYSITVSFHVCSLLNFFIKTSNLRLFFMIMLFHVRIVKIHESS
jgi:hypothetical protein